MAAEGDAASLVAMPVVLRFVGEDRDVRGGLEVVTTLGGQTLDAESGRHRGAIAEIEFPSTRTPPSPEQPVPRTTAPWSASPHCYSDPVMWSTVALSFGIFAVLSIFRYLRLSPASWDLGIFTEAMNRYAHLQAPVVDIKGPGFNLLGDHFHPLIAVLAPFFRLFPSAITLLVAQALLSAASIIPVYRAAAIKLDVPSARAISAAYGLSWGLVSMTSADFHEICFAVPLLACSLSALARGKPTAAVMWALPLVLVKEDQGFTVAAIGIVLAIVCRSRWRTGVLLAYLGIAASAIAIYVVIPHFNQAHTYPYWKDSGHLSGIFDGSDVKLPTLFLTLLPTAFIALRSPVLAVALPGIGMRFISSNQVYWGTSGHYSATAVPIVFVAAIDGISRARSATGVRRSDQAFATLARHAPAMMVAACVALAFQSPLTGLWSSRTYKLSSHVRAADTAVGMIPAGTTVEASLNELAPLAARDDVYWWGAKPPQWILYDQTSPEWNVSATFIATRHAGTNYRAVFNRDGIWLFERQS